MPIWFRVLPGSIATKAAQLSTKTCFLSRFQTVRAGSRTRTSVSDVSVLIALGFEVDLRVSLDFFVDHRRNLHAIHSDRIRLMNRTRSIPGCLAIAAVNLHQS